MQEIKYINKKSLARITALIYALISFATTLAVSVSTIANIVWQKDFGGSIIIVSLFNIGAGILLGLVISLIVALVGWLAGYIVALVYNIFARRFGGLKVELTEAADNKDQAGNQDKI